VTTYVIAGHPDGEYEEIEASIRFAHSQGTRIMLSEFSPVPGTPDAESSRPWADLAEPLSHNKTAFAIRRLGSERLNRLKSLTRELNGRLQWK
jgi:tRNA A37 methylthiotransferase MiaB